jgi:succinate dehydrogenase/fumarate reductase cytochrome b subunit
VTKAIALPRNTTRQSQGIQYGTAARLLHRFTGTVIVLFVLVHVIVQAVRHAPMLASASARAPWLEPLQQQPWIHAVLYFSIVFHTLYGLKLLAGDLGLRTHYRAALWVIVAVSLVPFLREMARYAGF